MMGDILWFLVGVIVGYLGWWAYRHRPGRDTRTVKWVASPYGALPAPTDAQLRAARDEFAPRLYRLRAVARSQLEALHGTHLTGLCAHEWTREPLCVDCGKSESEHGGIFDTDKCPRYRAAFSQNGETAWRHPNPAVHRCLLRSGHPGAHVCECMTLDPLP